MSFSCLDTQALFSFPEAAVPMGFEVVTGRVFLVSGYCFRSRLYILADRAFGHTWC